jgi:hypothetical protein
MYKVFLTLLLMCFITGIDLISQSIIGEKIETTVSTSPRSGYKIKKVSYDEILLFGGYTTDRKYNNQTWKWNIIASENIDNKGTHIIDLNGFGLTKGFYIVKINTGNKILTNKVILSN